MRGWLRVYLTSVCVCARALAYVCVHVCVFVSVRERISKYESLSCHLATEKVRSANKNAVLQAPFQCTELSSWPLCFSTLMLRLDFNKVPKAEDTKRWKVWPTGDLVMSALWISLVCVILRPHCLFSVFHLCLMVDPLPVLRCDCSSLICLNSPVCISSDFSQSFLKCKINTPLIRLITSWMNSNCQLILCGLPVSWLLLLQNINDHLSVALHYLRGYRTLMAFRGHTLDQRKTLNSSWPQVLLTQNTSGVIKGLTRPNSFLILIVYFSLLHHLLNVHFGIMISVSFSCLFVIVLYFRKKKLLGS